jgi:DNA-binding MarR family transcriptional regulator
MPADSDNPGDAPLAGRPTPRKRRYPAFQRWRVEATVLIHTIVATAEQIVAAQDWGDGPVVRATALDRLLHLLEHSEGCPSISEVARGLQISRQAAHPLVVAAARDGLVELLRHPEDRRIVQTRLTPPGRSLLAARRTRESAWVIVLLNGLDVRQIVGLTRALDVIRTRLRHDARDRGGLR